MSSSSITNIHCSMSEIEAYLHELVEIKDYRHELIEIKIYIYDEL